MLTRAPNGELSIPRTMEPGSPVYIRNVNNRSVLRRVLTTCVLPAWALLAFAGPSEAQTRPAAVGRPLETRESLQALVAEAERLRQTGRAQMLRERLVNGDFQDGDRVVLAVQVPGLSAVAAPETLMVTVGKILDFPMFADLPLHGVLRSELAALVTQHLATYYKEPVVRANPLIRLGVLGAVGRQDAGVYVSPEMLLTDVLNAVGGLSSNADVNRIEVRRGTETIIEKDELRTIVAEGMSIDRMHLRAGDQIVVGEKSRRNWVGWLQTGVATVAIILSIARRW
jgi:hypothetical protein